MYIKYFPFSPLVLLYYSEIKDTQFGEGFHLLAAPHQYYYYYCMCTTSTCFQRGRQRVIPQTSSDKKAILYKFNLLIYQI